LIWDPNNKQDVMTGVAKLNRHWYCFFVEIQVLKQRVPDLVAVKNMTGLVPDSMLPFLPKNTAGYKGDYHKVLNGESYL
jgi:hypothetical protein